MGRRMHVAWFAPVALILVGIGMAILGAVLLVSASWLPRRSLDGDPLIEPAARFVDGFRNSAGRPPTTSEFESWVLRQPPDLRYEGRGFAYQPLPGLRCPASPCRFRFNFWGGNAWIAWDPPQQQFDWAEALLVFALGLAAMRAGARRLPGAQRPEDHA